MHKVNKVQCRSWREKGAGFGLGVLRERSGRELAKTFLYSPKLNPVQATQKLTCPKAGVSFLEHENANVRPPERSRKLQGGLQRTAKTRSLTDFRLQKLAASILNT